MIDLHTHVLPGIDDGSESIEMTMELIHQAVAAGISGILATPHVNAHTTPAAEAAIIRTYQAVCEKIKEANLSVDLKLAAEVNLIGSDVDWTAHDWVIISGEQRYLLVETPFFQLPAGYADILFQIRLKKITPIIAHPERNVNFQYDHAPLLEWIKQGALLQLDAGSLTGMFGRECQRFSERLLRAGAVHLVASDTHRPQGRNFMVLKHASKKVEAMAGSDTMQRLFVENPKCIWEGKTLTPALPDENRLQLTFIDKIRRVMSTP